MQYWFDFIHGSSAKIMYVVQAIALTSGLLKLLELTLMHAT